MDSSSQICEEVEECQSSESGWTMYIGTPSDGGDDSDDSDDGHGSGSKDEGHDDDGDDGDGIDDDDDHDDKDNDHEDESDDSMASDASSGPSFKGYDVSRDNDKKLASFNKEKKGSSESKNKVRKNIRLDKRK